jgi:hypothetical protein
MRYLGLTVDSGWTFGPHYDLLVPKVTAAANALCGLLPNIGRAGNRMRRLYEGVIRSRFLYGAPIWAGDLMANRRNLTLLRRLHRTTAIRIARGDRTISHASLLRASNASEGTGGEEQRKERRPRQSGSPKRTDTTPRHQHYRRHRRARQRSRQTEEGLPPPVKLARRPRECGTKGVPPPRCQTQPGCFPQQQRETTTKECCGSKHI